jgi:hypothetical protein
MRTPQQIIGDDLYTQLIFEGYAVVPVAPTNAMRAAGTGMMPVEYDFRSMQSWGGEFPQAVRMVVVGFAPLAERADVSKVWGAMLEKASTT